MSMKKTVVFVYCQFIYNKLKKSSMSIWILDNNILAANQTQINNEWSLFEWVGDGNNQFKYQDRYKKELSDVNISILRNVRIEEIDLG